MSSRKPKPIKNDQAGTRIDREVLESRLSQSAEKMADHSDDAEKFSALLKCLESSMSKVDKSSPIAFIRGAQVINQFLIERHSREEQPGESDFVLLETGGTSLVYLLILQSMQIDDAIKLLEFAENLDATK